MIEFTTTQLNVATEKENPIDPIYGQSLLLWLREKFSGREKMSENDEAWQYFVELIHSEPKFRNLSST